MTCMHVQPLTLQMYIMRPLLNASIYYRTVLRKGTHLIVTGQLAGEEKMLSKGAAQLYITL